MPLYCPHARDGHVMQKPWLGNGDLGGDSCLAVFHQAGGSASFMPEVGMANALSSNNMDGRVPKIARGSGGSSLRDCN
jgi:hypothetical protein